MTVEDTVDASDARTNTHTWESFLPCRTPPAHPVRRCKLTESRRPNLETPIIPLYNPSAYTNDIYYETPTLKSVPAVSGTSRSTQHRVNSAALRRTNNGSILLQSPARSGHSNGMKKIFEDASQVIPASVGHERSVYAQLASNTQQTSPQQLGQHHNTVLNVAKLSLAELKHGAVLGMETLHSEPASASEDTVDSWSDDSAYLFTESQISSLTARLSMQEIQRWLADVSPDRTTDEARNLGWSITDSATSATLRHPESYAQADDPFGVLEFVDRESPRRDPLLKGSSHHSNQGPSCSRSLNQWVDDDYRAHRDRTLANIDASGSGTRVRPCIATMSTTDGFSRGGPMRYVDLVSSSSKPRRVLKDRALRPGTGRPTNAASLDDPFVTADTGLGESTPATVFHVSNSAALDQSSTPTMADTNAASRTFETDEQIELVPLSPNVCVERRSSRHNARGNTLVMSPKGHSSPPMTWVDAQYIFGEENASIEHKQPAFTMWHTPDRSGGME